MIFVDPPAIYALAARLRGITTAFAFDDDFETAGFRLY